MNFIIILLVFFMSIYCVIIIANIYSSAKGTRDSIEQGIVSTVQDNYKNTYHSNRESYTVGYRPNGKNFKEQILLDEHTIYNVLENNLELTKGVDGYSRIDKNKNKIFTINNINIQINNDSIRSGTNNFVADIKYKFIYYINFMGYKSKIEIPMRINSKYTNKF